jgi:hypothetical protein
MLGAASGPDFVSIEALLSEARAPSDRRRLSQTQEKARPLQTGLIF